MAKMRELDAPVSEAQVQECGEPMGMTPPMGETQPAPSHPSMSVNLNAQGMDNIESLMKLFTKVNPDMMPKTDSPMPSLTGPGPTIASISSEPELKMLPLDGPEDDADPEDDNAVDMFPGADSDEEGEEEKEEAFGNSAMGDDGPWTGDIEDAIPSGNDLHKQKSTFPKVAGGDNPMQRVKEGTDLRSQIHAELTRRLAEAKGAK